MRSTAQNRFTRYLVPALALAVLAWFAVGVALATETAVLTWDPPPVGTAKTYHIERKVGVCGDPAIQWTEIATVPSATLTYTDSATVEGKTHCYRVVASNPDDVKGEYSNEGDKYIPFARTAPPANFRVR